MELEVGARVRVKCEVIMYHVPSKRNEEVNVEGMEGVISGDLRLKDGVEMTATKPWMVKFAEPKMIGHFDDGELERVD